MIEMKVLFLFMAIMLFVCVAVSAAPLPDICAFPDTAAAQKAWQPQFGSPPVRVERTPEGTLCLVLAGEFKQRGDRLCWDYVGPLDLSNVGSVSLEVSAENGGRVATCGVYFGAGGGWYAHFSHLGQGGFISSPWRRVSWELEDFKTEGEPAGWDKVERFRFSLWAAEAGPVVVRLRGFQAKPKDLHRNFLLNGSFEIPGPLPFGWSSGHWGVGDLPWAADMELWRRHFALDASVAHSGRYSLRLVNAPGLPKIQAVSQWHTLPGKFAATYTLSAWLRADRDGLPVRIAVGDKSLKAEAGREWRRVVLSGVAPGTYVIVRLGTEAEGTLWIDDVQIQNAGHDTEEFHPHPQDETIAAREARVDWTPPRRTAAIAAGRQTRGPVVAAPVRIDEHGRLLVGEKPYLMHALGLEFLSDLKILDVIARAGFPDVCLYIRRGITTEELGRDLDYAAALGLRMIPWLDAQLPLDRFREHITTLKNHPALLCWYVYDEPGSEESFAEAEKRLRLAKELDPNHPALINYLPNKLTGHAGDIYSTDIYPIPHGQPTDAINGVATMAEAARAERKPVWIWLQGTGYAYWMAREPTPRELSCMAYGSLIKGARGIYYFAQIPRTRECWEEMRALCVELKALAPVLGSLDTAPNVTCDAKAVLAAAFRLDRKIVVLAVNTTPEPLGATFHLPVKATRANVLFEGRSIGLKNGAWADQFGIYERHVYELIE